MAALAMVLLGCGAHAEENRLEVSLERTLPREPHAQCEEGHASGRFRCLIEDDPGSNGDRVLFVSVGEGECWRAGSRPGRREIDGCIGH